MRVVGEQDGGQSEPGWLDVGRLPRASEVGLLTIKESGATIASGFYVATDSGEHGVVATSFPVHLSWFGSGFAPQLDLSEYALADYGRVPL